METLGTQSNKTAKRNGNEISDNNLQICEQESVEDLPPDRICWLLVLNILLFHLFTFYGITAYFQGNQLSSTLLFEGILGFTGGLGISVGAHRLWAHRSYKANWPLRLLLAILQVLAVQGSLWQWVAWHRAHHKHSDKKLDPHNAAKGFFYAHIGWFLTYDPKRFRMQLQSISMKDVEADPIVMWQAKYYDWLLLVQGILSVGIPCYCFGENIFPSLAAFCGRIIISHHLTFLVNSAGHLYGYKPYDENIYPGENKLVSYLSLGEGWHNYHHAFPWDYRSSEYGGFYRFNPSAALIECFAKIGWAYDLKTASPELVAKRMKLTGISSADLTDQ